MLNSLLQNDSGIVYISASDALSRFFVYDQKLPLYKNEIPSIEHGVWFLALAYYGEKGLANDMLKVEVLAKQPRLIAGWVEERCGKLPPHLLFRLGDLYHDVVMHQVERNSPFCAELRKQVHVHPEPREVKFMTCSSTSELILSTGWKKSTHERTNDRNKEVYPGFNVYGEIVYKAAQVALGYRNPAYLMESVEQFCARESSIAAKPQFTALMVGDSQFRCIESIAAGEVVFVPGGTFSTIARALTRQRLSVSDFAIVIVAAGVNDCQKLSARECEESVDEMVACLNRTKSRHTKILISPTFYIPKVQTSYAYAEWMGERFKASGFQVVDWNVTKSPFVYDKDKPRLDLFRFDKLHVNHMGFRKLWMIWAKHVPELQWVGYKLRPPQALKRQ